MNKGLLMHLAATFIYILMVMYILQEQSTSVYTRLCIVVFLILTNFICFIGCMNNDFYDKKINFKK